MREGTQVKVKVPSPFSSITSALGITYMVIDLGTFVVYHLIRNSVRNRARSVILRLDWTP